MLLGVRIPDLRMQRARTDFFEPRRSTLSNIKTYPRYRVQSSEILLSCSVLTNLQIIGIVWRQLSPEIKSLWEIEADEERRQHAEAHPTYRYKPRRLAPRDQGIATDGRPIGRRAQKPTDSKDARQHKVIAAKILKKGSLCQSQTKDIQEQEDGDVDGEELTS